MPSLDAPPWSSSLGAVSRVVGRVRKPLETYQGRPWALEGRPRTLYDQIEERRAKRVKDRDSNQGEASPDRAEGEDV